MSSVLERSFAGARVLVTGHTGFKGSWLSIWLGELGAEVVGFSLDPPTEPSNFALSRLSERMLDVRGDVRDLPALQAVMSRHRPHYIFHLAAQPLVLPSYDAPKETFDTNAGGTVNVLEAVRHVDSVQAVVCITTDKVYENQEWSWGYREIDRLGGHDPYSSSKAMAELAIDSYRRSFFRYGNPAVASARAGNVIGGGDFADYRLLPDCIRALMAGEPIQLRHPDSVRPWQHVLESLSGYLWLADRLAMHGQRYAQAWNFAPWELAEVTSRTIVERAIDLWGGGSWVRADDPQARKETTLLRLNWEKAARELGWKPVYDWQTALTATMDWYRRYLLTADAPGLDMYSTCTEQIDAYCRRAAELALPWAV